MKKYSGDLIYRQSDQWGIVEVVDLPKIRELHFGNSIVQSSMYLDKPYELEMEYNRVMMSSLSFQTDPKRVLFLGLGGGSKPKYLWKNYPNCVCEVVERSPLVIEVAKKFFHVPEEERFQIFCGDALEFLEKKSLKPIYDLLFVDLYIADALAEVVTSPTFFSNCRKTLHSGGILIFNLWQYLPHAIQTEIFQNLERALGKNYSILKNGESPNLVVMVFNQP